MTAVTDPKLEIALAEAAGSTARPSSTTSSRCELAPQEFGRIAAQTAKQVILQRVRDAERDAHLLGVHRQGRARSSAASSTASRSAT